MTSQVISLEELQSSLQRGRRLLGLDLGTKTIGLALSDIEHRIATPMKTLKRVKFKQDAEALGKVVAQFDIAAFILGLPLNMDGSEGPRVQATKAFVRNLAPVLPLPVVFWDERLSTVAAERALLSVDMSRAKRAEIIDATAAAYILQGALDRMNHMTR